MKKTIIKNVQIVLEDKILKNYNLVIEGSKIKEITNRIPRITEPNVIDGRKNYLSPGFIDLHIHGVHDKLIDNGTKDLTDICEILPRYGVTGFLPTVCPLPKGKDAKFLSILSKVKSQGTQILGFHLEGPFLTITGALPKEALGKADINRVRNLIKSAKPFKAVFSISPDFKNIEKLIPIMKKNNTPVFMTHTKADVEQTLKSIMAGANHATHFYDVFYSPSETDPGVRPCGAVEAILASPEVSIDFIVDGEHVDPIAIRMALNCKAADKVCLITDANIGAGLNPGRYIFAKDEISFAYKGAPARGTNNSRFPGCLYGSGLTMNKAVQNTVRMLGIDLCQAVKMASTNPAKVLKIKNKGLIKEGFDADLVMFDKEINILKTFIKGKCCYEKI
ncbi:MAG: N-acetylglucosamine-6-phosphate deacetylase [Planctomycetes bacterium ADurb.Bin401]|nr:MAG: N-acetylglucosamine-6-phosphate deacetylase [Planctomycetes bacterium ADurb.Bin401]